MLVTRRRTGPKNGHQPHGDKVDESHTSWSDTAGGLFLAHVSIAATDSLYEGVSLQIARIGVCGAVGRVSRCWCKSSIVL